MTSVDPEQPAEPAIAAPDLEWQIGDGSAHDPVGWFESTTESANTLLWWLRYLRNGARTPLAEAYWEARARVVREAMDSASSEDVAASIALRDVFAEQLHKLHATFPDAARTAFAALDRTIAPPADTPRADIAGGEPDGL